VNVLKPLVSGEIYNFASFNYYMEFHSLNAISPIDGRYSKQVEKLHDYFSEYALIKYRLYVEVEYFVALCEHPLPQLKHLNETSKGKVRSIFSEFTIEDAARIKEIEKVTNHDVKAVEYYIKEKMDSFGLEKEKEYVHFGLTSQDINNTSVPLSLKEATENEYLPYLDSIIEKLKQFSRDWMDIPMLARTHGQPASPTTLGKEIAVFVNRLEVQKKHIEAIPFSAKFGGATGNFNAHHVAYPEIDWMKFANHFVNDKLGLSRSEITTQIEHYDNMAALFDAMKRINTIFIDLDRDVWTYISMDYFKQQIKKGEVGSSAMPHKVNPIDFENSEGNFGLANAMLNHLSGKLPISRLQRDLTDSTVMRNIGVPIGYTFIAMNSLMKGLSKLLINKPAIEGDLESNWTVVAEAIQTILRREGYANPYEQLKELTRTNDVIGMNEIHIFIDNLQVNDEIKKELKGISPFNYTGIKPKI